MVGESTESSLNHKIYLPIHQSRGHREIENNYPPGCVYFLVGIFDRILR